MEKISVVQAIICTMVYCFGSSSLLAFSLGTEMPWISNPEQLMLSLVFSAIFIYSPGDFVFKTVSSADCLLSKLTAIFDSTNRVFAVTVFGVDAVAGHYKKAQPSLSNFVAMTIGGLIMGFGGSLLWEAFDLKGSSWKFHLPEQLIKPSCAMYHSLCVALSYIFLVYKLGMPTKIVVSLLIITSLAISFFRQLKGSTACCWQKKDSACAAQECCKGSCEIEPSDSSSSLNKTPRKQAKASERLLREK